MPFPGAEAASALLDCLRFRVRSMLSSLIRPRSFLLPVCSIIISGREKNGEENVPHANQPSQAQNI